MATVKELKVQAEELGIDTEGLKKADLEAAIKAASFKGIRFKEPSLDLDTVVDLVDNGSFSSAAAELETNVGEVAWHYNNAQGPAIEADDPEDLANLIAEARDEGKEGWTNIAGRAGLTRGSTRKLYALATDRDPTESNIGRGGRGAGGVYITKEGGDDTEAKPKSKAKAKPAKKATAKKATKAKAAPKGKALPDWDEAEEDDIREALEGKTVTTAKGDVSIAEVKRFGKNKAGKRVIQVETDEGDKANVVLTTVTAIA